jgi:hypothetical protein
MDSCQDASFDLFSRPPMEDGLQDFHDQEILPLTALSSTSTTVEFNIAGEGDEYIDLSELRLYLRVKINTTDKSEIADGSVELVKFWPHSLFRQCDLFLNGTLVTTSSNMYHYTAYASSLLSFPKDVKDYQLDVLEHANGWKIKKGETESEALIRLHLPMCNQQRLLPNGVTIKIRFLRTPDEFVLKAKEAKYQIELEKCSLFVRRITPTPSMLLNHADTLSKINCLYPIERVWPKFFTLNKGVREFDLANISQGQLPSRIIVGLVSTKAFSGSVDTDPYKFQHFNLDYISLQCNGRAIPSIAITTDYDKGFYRRAYHLLLDTIQGPCSDNDSIGLSLEDYKGGSCFYGFTLSRSLTGPSEALPRRENGYVNAKLRFSKPLPDNVNAIFFMEYNNFVEIDSARNIYMDFAA